jgi:hypothetical protein
LLDASGRRSRSLRLPGCLDHEISWFEGPTRRCTAPVERIARRAVPCATSVSCPRSGSRRQHTAEKVRNIDEYVYQTSTLVLYYQRGVTEGGGRCVHRIGPRAETCRAEADRLSPTTSSEETSKAGRRDGPAGQWAAPPVPA